MGSGNGEPLSYQRRGSDWSSDENLLEMDGDGCTALRMQLMPLTCALEMVKTGNFRLYIFR